MADYSRQYIDPTPRFTPAEQGTKYRWDNEVSPNVDPYYGDHAARGRTEVLARELMELQKVVKKLAEKVYPEDTVIKANDGAVTMVPKSELDAANARIEELEEELRAARDDRDMFESDYIDAIRRAGEAEVALDEIRDILPPR